jgi:hypothetical protein
MYRIFGYAHHQLARAAGRLEGSGPRPAPRKGGRSVPAGQLGQGTVEYVALILLVALVMAGVVAAMKGFKTDQGRDLGDAIIKKIRDAVARVRF